MMLVDAFTQSRFGPTITVKSAKDVTLRGIRVTGIAPQSDEYPHRRCVADIR